MEFQGQADAERGPLVSLRVLIAGSQPRQTVSRLMMAGESAGFVTCA